MVPKIKTILKDWADRKVMRSKIDDLAPLKESYIAKHHKFEKIVELSNRRLENDRENRNENRHDGSRKK